MYLANHQERNDSPSNPALKAHTSNHKLETIGAHSEASAHVPDKSPYLENGALPN